MNWKTTWILVALSLVTSAYIYFFETTPINQPGQARLLQFQPNDVQSIQLRRTNEFILRAERADNRWNLVAPILYPAQTVAIEQLLIALSAATPQTHIPEEEIAARQQTAADFGLDLPLADLTLELKNNAGRVQVSFGTKTTIGDNVYLTLIGGPGIYVVGANLFDKLPRTSADWRDPRLMDLSGLKLDRMEVRTPAGGYEIRTDSTNNLFFLSKPSYARADTPKVQNVLRHVQGADVLQFVTDNPRAELDQYGLQPPQLEVAFGHGTNDNLVVQFGSSPPDQPALVYARRMAQTNIVLVSKSVVDVLQIPHTEFRDRRLLSFSPPAIKLVEVVGNENFSIHREDDGRWMVRATPAYLGDTQLIQQWIQSLANLEGVVEKDVVTEFGGFGLDEPALQYILKTAVTNATGEVTNRTADQLDFGAIESEKVFARRATENSVHSIPRALFDRFPTAAWQLRDRRVWSFSTNEIKSVTLSSRGQSRQLIRGASGGWVLAPGSSGAINPDAVAETVERLSQLQAEIWLEQGGDKRNLYGITADSHQIAFELDKGGQPQLVSLQLGAVKEGHSPFAMATLNNQSWILEIPLELFVRVRLSLFPPDTSE